MEKRDFLQDQIEKAGCVLGQILSGFFTAKNGDDLSAVAVTNEKLRSELGIDTRKILELDSPELEAYIESLPLGSKGLQELASYFLEMGVVNKGVDAAARSSMLDAALKIYTYSEAKNTTLSLSSMALKARIEKELSSTLI